MVLLVFILAGTSLALPTEAVAEIVFEPRLVRPPGAPPALAGVMNLRGWLVPVVGLAQLFGLPPSPAGVFRPLIVLRRPAPLPAPWAVRVDQVVDVVAAAHEELLPPLGATLFAACVTSVYASSEGAMIPVLSPDCLLDRREAEALAAMRDRAAERWKEFALDD
jgi:purine-binding chemotaxis protein CheW